MATKRRRYGQVIFLLCMMGLGVMLQWWQSMSIAVNSAFGVPPPYTSTPIDVMEVLGGSAPYSNVPDKIREVCQIVDPAFSCAPWLNNSRSSPLDTERMVLFNAGRFQTFSTYYRARGYLGGEAYWSAGLAAILESLDFKVVTMDNQPQPPGSDLERRAHRIVSDCDGEYTRQSLYDPQIMCKVRMMNWWPKPTPHSQHHCVLSPFQLNGHDVKTIHLPFLVHSQVLPVPPTAAIPAGTKKNVFLLSKRCDFSAEIIRGLMKLGVRLHATCFLDRKDFGHEFLKVIHNHGKLKPLQFRLLMHHMDIVIGFGKPRLSPTPFEALANGAVFINPIVKGRKHNVTQNDAVYRMVGAPYTYTYYKRPGDDPNATVQEVLATVRRALDNPAKAYIPPESSVCELRKHVCKALIEDNAQCERGQMCLATCQKQVSGLNQDKYKEDMRVLLEVAETGNQTRLTELAAKSSPP